MNKTILIVAENRNLEKKLADFLCEMKYRVKMAQHAKSALDMAFACKPDLILCQEKMGNISGGQVAAYIRMHEPLREIPFLLLSSEVPSAEEIRNYSPEKVKFDDFIQFPAPLSALYGNVTKWLECEGRPTPIAQRIMPRNSETELKSKKIRKKGRVSQTSISRLLYDLIQHEQSGYLLVKGDRWLKIKIHDGQVTDVESNYIPEDTLGCFLMKANRITRKEHEASLKRSRKLNILQGQALVQMNLFTEQEISVFVTQQKSLKCLRLFHGKWDRAEYKFSPRPSEQTAEGAMMPVSLKKIFKTGIMRVVSAEQLMGIFLKKQKQTAPLRLTEHFSEVTDRLALGRNIVEKARWCEEKSLDDLESLVPEHFDSLLRLAFLLLVTKGAKLETGAPCSNKELEVEQVMRQGDALLLAGALSEALACFEKIRASEKFADVAATRAAWCRYLLDPARQRPNKLHMHKNALRKLAEQYPKQDCVWQYLGQICMEEGKKQQAMRYFETATRINSGNQFARRQLQLLHMQARTDRYYHQSPKSATVQNFGI